MYKFVCSNKHTSWSSSKEQRDPACPKCGEPIILVSNESEDSPTKPVSNE